MEEKQAILTKLSNNEPLSSGEYILVCQAISQSSPSDAQQCPPYHHEAKEPYIACGFKTEAEAQHFIIDENEEMKRLNKLHNRTSEMLEIVEQRMLTDWRVRRILLMSYLEMADRLRHPLGFLRGGHL